MKQDELWENKYHLILNFIQEQKKLPSKHRIEEHQMLNWIKYQKKRMSQGKLTPERMENFMQLMEICSHYLRKNQYAYTNMSQRKQGFCVDLFDID